MSCSWVAWSMRREIIERVGPFDPILIGSEDWNFVLRLVLRYVFTYCEGLPVSAYSMHATNLTKESGPHE